MTEELLHSTVYGSVGRPLVLLHGVFGSSGQWASLAKRWAADGREVHALDLRGHGRSFRAAEMSVAALAGDVARYLDGKAIPQAAVLGHSLGGRVAMEMACRYRERCQALVLGDIADRAYDSGWIKSVAEMALAVEKEEIKDRGEALAAIGSRTADDRFRFLLAQNLFRRPDGTYAFRFDAGAISAGADSLTGEFPAELSYPGKVLSVRGGASPYVRAEDLVSLRAHFPRLQTATLPQAGHWLHADSPEAFYRVVSAFLRQ